ncbi:MAG: hypothetical protein JNM17_22545 [Archangium sp.]|nr:hypothetical protein [Archangium sp.]
MTITTQRWFFAFLAVQFIVPAISYLATPDTAIASLDAINRMLGGGAYVVTESRGHVWHMLAVGNVMTLGFMCALLAIDLRRFLPILPSLAFLKAFSALSSLGLALAGHPPLFFAVFALDGITTVAMIVAGVTAKRALRRADGELVLPTFMELVLVDPRRIAAQLARAHAAGLSERLVTPEQVYAGIVRMWKRVLFRSETIGTSTQPVRANARARLLAFRGVRLPFLLAERFVAPFDFSGLLSSPERIIRHVLGAHHQPEQLVYDLELLSMQPGALAQLEAEARAIVESDSSRARWLKDLCVHVGYHESVVDAVRHFRAGSLDPDLSLRGFLTWCSEQPLTSRA